MTQLGIHTYGVMIMIQDYTINIFNKIGMSGHSMTLTLLGRTADHSELNTYMDVINNKHWLWSTVFANDPYDATVWLRDWSMIGELGAKVRVALGSNVFKMFGKLGWQTIYVYSYLASRMISIPAERRVGEQIAYGVMITMERSGRYYSMAENIWLRRSMTTLGLAVQACGRFRLAIRLMELCKRLETDPEFSLQDIDIAMVAAESYKGLLQYKPALEELFHCFEFNKNMQGIYHPNTVTSMKKIIDIMDLRGPQLYDRIETVLLNIFDAFGRNKETTSKVYHLLWKAWERGGIDTRERELEEEYSNALALRATDRPTTPDLQDFFYFQNLETWVHNTKVSQYHISSGGGGGWVSELDHSDGISGAGFDWV
ncbi:hypothetical protein TWF694_005751 [Orbilia ellipsospora]|uniref:Uncharacterized protein n=1 Tax=Orbilia ellipsospora TaxID=2528407 RepID=A0AAV9WXX6_9PEZI